MTLRSKPHIRKQEVTRRTRLAAPDTNVHASGSYNRRRVVEWSGPIEDLFGYTLENVGDNEDWWLQRVHPDDLPGILDSISKLLSPTSGSPYASDARIGGFDYRFRHINGHYVLVSDRIITTRDRQGNVTMFNSVIFDKEQRRLERKEYQRRLASENHIALIADNTPSGIYMMDPQGYTTYMNTAAEQITGFTFDELYDYTFHDAIHSCRPNGDPYPLHECPIVQYQRRGIAVKNETEVFVHKDGHHYDIVYSVSPVGDYTSGGAVIEFRDVTDEKRIERERLNAILVNEQQSIRIKESEVHKANMTSFVSFVCHELRNPLQGVTSSAEFLTDTLQKLEALTNNLSTGHVQHMSSTGFFTDTNSQALSPSALSRRRSTGVVEVNTLVAMEGLITYAKELVSNIATCASHQALITNNVLDLSRLDADKVEPLFEVVDVHALGEQVVSMMTSRAQAKSIKLQMAVAGGAPIYLKADATLLSQVLLNLISNAVKFTPTNGTIDVDLHPDAPAANGKIKLHGSVTDNGLGMTEAEQQRVFQRFSQANRKVAQLYGGSGLGLSISKELVRVMGGEMQVKSTQGKGSTFSFTSLHDSPTKDELLQYLRNSGSGKDHSPTANNASMDATNKPAPSFRMICVAEDNPYDLLRINLKHLSKTLSLLNYPHILCTNGREALEEFCQKGSIVDAVIIDMSMPVMDGLEATRLMRQNEIIRSVEAGGKYTRVPIIALSGNALKEQVNDAMAAGTSDYLVKPCKQADLKRTLNYWENVVHTGAPHKPMSHINRGASGPLV